MSDMVIVYQEKFKRLDISEGNTESEIYFPLSTIDSKGKWPLHVLLGDFGPGLHKARDMFSIVGNPCID